MTRPRLLPALAALAVAAVVGLAAAAAVRPDAGHADAPASPVVVRVGDVVVTADAFAARLRGVLERTGQADGPAVRQDVLERVVNHALLAHDARAAGLDRTDGFRAEAEALEAKLLLEALFARVVYDTVTVTDEGLADLYERVNTTLEARHLYARTRAGAERLAERLAAGESFEALAHETFADPVLRANGGAVGPFTFDEMDPAFEDAAFALRPGETSGPVRTAHGWSLIRLDARRTTPTVTAADFAARRGQFAAYARRRAGERARTELLRATEARLAIRFHDDATDRLHGVLTGRVVLDEDAGWLGAPLVTFGDGARTTWTAADVRARAAHTDVEQRAAVRTRAELEAFVAGLAVREALLEEARRHGLHEEPTYALARRAALDDALAARARARVEEAADVAEADARAYFDAEADRFALPERVHVREILADRRAALDALRPQLATTSFADLARRHSLRPGADANGGDLGPLDRDALGRLADPVFAARPGDVIGPFEVAGRYALLQVGARVPGRLRTFEEARAEVEAVLLRTARAEAVRAHLAALRARTPVHVDAAAAAAVRLTP